MSDAQTRHHHSQRHRLCQSRRRRAARRPLSAQRRESPFRHSSPFTAAAGCRARATPSNIGARISPRAASHVFSISYRLAVKTKTFPEAVQDVLAGVQFLRGKAGGFGIDPARIGLLGASAGAHLAALAAISGKKFLGAYPDDAFASTDASVKALIGVYGIYDVNAMWLNYQIQGGRDNNIQKFMGGPPMAEPAGLFRRLADQLRDLRQERARRSPRHRHRGRPGRPQSCRLTRSRSRSSRPISSSVPASFTARRITG